jgi:hypothetical protein
VRFPLAVLTVFSIGITSEYRHKGRVVQEFESSRGNPDLFSNKGDSRITSEFQDQWVIAEKQVIPESVTYRKQKCRQGSRDSFRVALCFLSQELPAAPSRSNPDSANRDSSNDGPECSGAPASRLSRMRTTFVSERPEARYAHNSDEQRRATTKRRMRI